MGEFHYEGHRIEYDSYGEGERVLVLVHGLLMNRRMFDRLGGRRTSYLIASGSTGSARSRAVQGVARVTSDSGMLAEELANARLIEANSIFEWRFSPDRLNAELAAFLAEV